MPAAVDANLSAPKIPSIRINVDHLGQNFELEFILLCLAATICGAPNVVVARSAVSLNESADRTKETADCIKQSANMNRERHLFALSKLVEDAKMSTLLDFALQNNKVPSQNVYEALKQNLRQL